VDPIRPIGRSGRTVQPVELSRLTPLEREQEKDRRERARKRREKAQNRRQSGENGPSGGLDVRA
jgi:hypothetical protein